MEWEGEHELLERDEVTGAWMAIAIHSTRLGPAVGGTRMKAYPSAEEAAADARRLAAAMTLKMAVPGMAWGGGKGVIAVPQGLSAEARRGLLRRYGERVASFGGRYRTAPDIGTSSDDMDVVAETAAPFVFGCTAERGGAGPSGLATAVGVHAAIGVACETVLGTASMRGRRVLVQGAGSVGGTLLARLLHEGADVSFSEVDDLAIRRWTEAGARFVPPDAVAATACDVYSPCAFGGVLSADTAPRIVCRAVVGGANNQLEADSVSALLAARGILYAPDFVANAGGAMAGIRMEADGWSRERAEREVVERISATLRSVFALSRDRGVTTDEAAREIARRRLEKGIGSS
jgi:leucine dehydrogenase